MAAPHPGPLFPAFVGTVVFVNGDALDVCKPDGSIDCYPAEWCKELPMNEQPKRPRGRPPVEDKRKPRGGFNDAEWAEVKRRASEAGMTAAAWVRMRTLEQ